MGDGREELHVSTHPSAQAKAKAKAWVVQLDSSIAA